MIGDLHCHTIMSDGSSSLEDLILYGKRGGMDFIAVTDHDTTAGNTRAVVLGKRYGINVIPGVEFSSVDKQRENKKVHILCYLPQIPERLQGLCSRTLKNRTQAGEEMIRRVMRYYPVTAEHIARYTSGSQSIYKVHIMLALMDLGYTDRIYSDLFHQLFSSRNGSCYVPFDYPDVREVVETIRQAGGVAVMAHPFQYGGSYELLEELANKIKDGSLCALGGTAPNPVLTTLRHFRNEYEDHIYKKKCTALSGKPLLTYSITAEACKSCSLCSRKCPVGAISGEKGVPYVIDTEKCIKCGKCLESCKFGAVVVE